MASIQCRPEVNALTVPQSYKITYISRDSIGTDGLLAAMAAENPNYSVEDNKTMLTNLVRVIQKSLLNGSQVTIDGMLTFGLSFTGRLDAPDDPLPPVEKMLHVNVHVLAPFLNEIKHQAQIERLPMAKRLPLITKAEDTVLKLRDVLNPNGALRLNGSDLLFDPADEDCGCVLEGTRSGRKVQSRHTLIANSEITILPDIPAQNDPWNNEYLLSVSTQYTEHGTVRTGIYERRLRAPLTVHGLSSWTGILTGKAEAAYVSITGGSVSADTVLRIQAVLDLQNERMLLSLLDMREGGGAQGAEVSVTQNGAYILPGFAGSPVSSMEVTVQNYAALWEMIRNDYGGRLVDVLDVRQGS